MRTSTRLLCVAILLAPLAFASDPCVKEGETVNLEFENPDISGFGPGAKIGTTNAWEADPVSDDSLGEVKPGSETTSVPVGNDGDNLTAGSEVGDGTTGDDCFEIYVEWTINYYTTITTTLDVSAGPVTVSKSLVQIVPATATIRSPVKVICPC